MRLVDKYILRSFLIPLFYCLFIFISIYVIIDLFGHLDEIIKEHVGLRVLGIYYLTYCPSIIIQIMPTAMLIATMYTLGSFARHNEITALRASGIGIWNILKPFLITGLLISTITLFANDELVPRSTHTYLKIKEEKIEKKKGRQPSAKVLKNVALYGEGNKIIYAKNYDPKTKVLRDLIIHEHDKRQNIISKITATEARWSGKGWTAFNITIYKLNKEGDIAGEPKFQHRDRLDIAETPEDFQKQKYNTEVLSISELRDYIRQISQTNSMVLKGILVEAHSRVAYPFANIVAVLIGAAFCLRAKRSGRFLGLGMGFLIGLLFYGVSAICLALGKGGMLMPFIAAWFSNIAFGAWGIYLINKY